MKSKKAIKLIKDNTLYTDGVKMDTTGYVGVAVSIGKAYAAIEIAGEEIKEKAIEVHLNNCPHLYVRNCDISENGMCQYRSGGKCKYMSKFIEELSK